MSMIKGKPGQILIRNENDEWVWVSPRVRADVWPILLMMTLVLVFVFFASRYARAQTNLPGGVTCEQIVQYASMMRIPNTSWGRAQARIIAATLGMRVTGAQLDAAAECLRQKRAAR